MTTLGMLGVMGGHCLQLLGLGSPRGTSPDLNDPVSTPEASSMRPLSSLTIVLQPLKHDAFLTNRFAKLKNSHPSYELQHEKTKPRDIGSCLQK